MAERRTHDHRRHGTLSLFAERFTREWNARATPFVWLKTPGQILAKAVRKPRADPGGEHNVAWR